MRLFVEMLVLAEQNRDLTKKLFRAITRVTMGMKVILWEG